MSAGIIGRAADRCRGYRVDMATEKEILRINGHEVTVTNPRKVYFPVTGHTKLDLVNYYLAWRMARCAAPADGRWP